MAVLLHTCWHTVENQTRFDSSVTLMGSRFKPRLRCLHGAWSTLASTTHVAHVQCEPSFVYEILTSDGDTGSDVRNFHCRAVLSPR
jgi:hypothetical protein